MTKNKIYHLLEMTVDDWIRNSTYNLPAEIKEGFVLLAGYMERYLTEKYEYETEWDKNEDVFIRIFDDSPIDKNHRKISLRVSFYERFIEVCHEGMMICNMHISYAKTPIVTFRSVPNTWEETHKIQDVFSQLFQNIFKEKNIHE